MAPGDTIEVRDDKPTQWRITDEPYLAEKVKEYQAATRQISRKTSLLAQVAGQHSTRRQVLRLQLSELDGRPLALLLSKSSRPLDKSNTTMMWTNCQPVSCNYHSPGPFVAKGQQRTA